MKSKNKRNLEKKEKTVFESIVDEDYRQVVDNNENNEERRRSQKYSKNNNQYEVRV
jgi:hypothetical protein